MNISVWPQLKCMPVYVSTILLTNSPKGNDRSPDNKQVFSNNSQVSKKNSIGQVQPTLQSMVRQNSDVNKGRNSVANLPKNMTLYNPNADLVKDFVLEI